MTSSFIFSLNFGNFFHSIKQREPYNNRQSIIKMKIKIKIEKMTLQYKGKLYLNILAKNEDSLLFRKR